MERKNRLKPLLLWGGGCLGALVLLIIVGNLLIWISFRVITSRAQHKLLEGAKIGSTEAEVIERLGNPPWEFTKQADLDAMYPMYKPKASFPIEHKVLMFRDGGWWCVFVYINKQGRVTRAVLAKT
jgi:hypothetical protein